MGVFNMMLGGGGSTANWRVVSSTPSNGTLSFNIAGNPKEYICFIGNDSNIYPDTNVNVLSAIVNAKAYSGVTYFFCNGGIDFYNVSLSTVQTNYSGGAFTITPNSGYTFLSSTYYLIYR